MTEYISANTIRDGAKFIPVDEGNRDYRKILEDGTPITPLPVVDEATRERSLRAVSRFQLKIALLNAGLLDSAIQAVRNAPRRVQIAFDEAGEFRRTSQIVGALRNALSLTDEQMDAIFEDARQIEP